MAGARPPASHSVLPLYLRIEVALDAERYVDEIWAEPSGHGCTRSRAATDPLPATTQCATGYGDLLADASLDSLRARAREQSPTAAIDEALDPRGSPGDRAHALLRLLAYDGVDPALRQAAFDRLGDAGFRVTSATAATLVLSWSSPTGVIEAEVDRSSTLVTRITAPAARGDHTYSFTAGRRPMP